MYIRKKCIYYLYGDLIARGCRYTSHEITSNKGSNNHRSLARRLLLKWVPIKMQRCQNHWHLADFPSIPQRKEVNMQNQSPCHRKAFSVQLNPSRQDLKSHTTDTALLRTVIMYCIQLLSQHRKQMQSQIQIIESDDCSDVLYI